MTSSLFSFNRLWMFFREGTDGSSPKSNSMERSKDVKKSLSSTTREEVMVLATSLFRCFRSFVRDCLLNSDDHSALQL